VGRFIRLAVVSVAVVVLVSADAAFGAARAAQRRITLTIGPARLLAPSFGYAVAYRTVRHGVTARTAIGLFVYDEGRWRNSTPPMLREDEIDAIDDVAFVSRRDGWVAAYNCATASVYLYRTGDGGRSWQSLGKPASRSCGGGPTYLSFVDERRGWMEPVSPNGPVGVLLETSDGGRSWTQVASGPPSEVNGRALPCLAPIAFTSISSGWMGRCPTGGVFATDDGGRSWQAARIAVPNRGDARLDLPRFDEGDGVVAATIGTRPFSEIGRTRAVVFSVTHDGGRAWTVRSTRRIGSCPLTAYYTNVWPAGVADQRVWWIVAGSSRPTAQVTTDAGRTWRTTTAQGLPTRRCSALSVSAAGPRTALVVARQSTDATALFQTVDAGHTWRQVTLLRR
jgi:photosystem II stability/assembly factor-like uncharacterized protein